MVGVAVAAIVGIGVAIPVINDVISAASVTGITSTVLNFIPVMVGLLVFIGAASPIMRMS
jgi:hypothetical protein